MFKICQHCDKEFSKKKTSCKKSWAVAKFCSVKCACHNQAKNNYTRVEKKCFTCEKEFSVQKHREHTASCCSQKCFHKKRNQGKTPLFKLIRKSRKYLAWRIFVFKRDNYTCQECGARNKKGHGKTVELQADHIKPFALFPELRFDLGNGRTLCVDCHRQTETWGRCGIFRNLSPA